MFCSHIAKKETGFRRSLRANRDERTKPNLTGAPCSHQRTWAEKDGRSPSNDFNHCVKAFEEFILRPRTPRPTGGTRQV
jgi:hypothetical protein